MVKTFKTQFSFVFLWSALVIVGTIAGFSISYLLAGNFDDRDYAFAVFLLVFVVGLFIGLAQWTAMIIKLRNVWQWIPATAIGYSVGSFGSFFILSSLGQVLFTTENQYSEFYQWFQSIMILMLTGMFTGMLQWFALGRKVRTSLKWLLVSGLALVIGFLPTLSPANIYATDHVLSSIFFGTVSILGSALLTGTFAGQLIVSPEKSND